MVRNEGMRRAEVADARARVPKRLLVDEEGEEEVAGGKVDNSLSWSSSRARKFDTNVISFLIF